MKDRILQIMKREGMTQQQFSLATGLAPASLSSIFTGRTLPTLKHAEALHKRFPNLSMSWLLFGDGEMFVEKGDETSESPAGTFVQDNPSVQDSPATLSSEHSAAPLQTELDFRQPAQASSIFPAGSPLPFSSEQLAAIGANPQMAYGYMKKPDIKQRKIAEIRIFFDDGTFEVFPGNA